MEGKLIFTPGMTQFYVLKKVKDLKVGDCVHLLGDDLKITAIEQNQEVFCITFDDRGQLITYDHKSEDELKCQVSRWIIL